jgi:hypothetical protein
VQPVRSGPSAARLRGIRAASAPDAPGRSSHNPPVVGSSPTRPTAETPLPRQPVDRNLGYIRRTIKPAIGSTQVRKVRGPLLDTRYARLMRCGNLACTGKPFTEHRNIPDLRPDPADPRPKWQQAADKLRAAIRSAELASGDALPSVPELHELQPGRWGPDAESVPAGPGRACPVATRHLEQLAGLGAASATRAAFPGDREERHKRDALLTAGRSTSSCSRTLRLNLFCTHTTGAIATASARCAVVTSGRPRCRIGPASRRPRARRSARR